MLEKKLLNKISSSLEDLHKNHRFKQENAYESPQGSEVIINGKKVLQFAANNYLGLANDSVIVTAAKTALEKWGYGTASVRFISGTQAIHRELEEALARFLGVDDAILYSSCFAANEGFFATLVNDTLGDDSASPDVIYSDALNHASIIDGLRLCKSERIVKRVYPHGQLQELERLLQQDATDTYRFRIVATDGVFSMEGTTAPLTELIALAKKYQALLFVDDSHAIGVLGKNGQGTPEALGVHGQVDILSGTFGKALGGAMGGYLAGPKELIEFMRQKSRPYIFSNSIPPMVAASTLAAIKLLNNDSAVITRLHENTTYFRDCIKKLGFNIIDGSHPIVAIMIKEASLAQSFSQLLLEKGIYVVGLWFPVVPEGEARLRVQISAAHSHQQLDTALRVFAEVGKKLKII